MADNQKPQQAQKPLSSEKLNELLVAWSNGRSAVEPQLIEAIYPHIHKIAHNQFKSKQASALQTTEIVNEAFMHMLEKNSTVWKNKQHFYAIAAKVIRNVVIDHHRSETRQKRGGVQANLTLERVADFIESPEDSTVDWLTLDQLINELASIDKAAAQVVEYKIFGGYTLPEMAEIMSVSESTVSRNWQFARLWLLARV